MIKNAARKFILLGLLMLLCIIGMADNQPILNAVFGVLMIIAMALFLFLDEMDAQGLTDL